MIKRGMKLACAFLLVVALIVAMTPLGGFTASASAATMPSNPKWNSNQTYSTWDCIYFGNYCQSSSSSKDKIKWRVLQVSDTNSDGIVDDALILADKILDCQPFKVASGDDQTDWGDSTLRYWLNSEFMDSAFTASEKSAIKTTTIKTTGTYGYQETTSDKVFLMSSDEMLMTKYGFYKDPEVNYNTRQASATSYTYHKYKDSAINVSKGNYWLRSKTVNDEDFNSEGFEADVVWWNGILDCSRNTIHGKHGVRPALHINLSSSAWSNAGTVSSKVNMSSCSAALSSISYKYNGTSRKPTATVEDCMGDRLIAGKDYTVSYSDNKSVGTAKVTITGIDKYYGTITKTFKINKGTQKIKVAHPTKSLKASAVKSAKKTYTFKTTGKKTSLKYVKLTAKNKKAISKVVISGSKVKVTVKKGAKKGIYKIKVYAKSNTNYNASAKKMITIKVK